MGILSTLIIITFISIFLPDVSSSQDITAEPNLQIVGKVAWIGNHAVREPMIAEHPSGALFISGYSRAPEEFSDPPNLYKSIDTGNTWSQVDVGNPGDGALGNSDVDLKISEDGIIYFLTMGFDRSVAEGTHVAIGVSQDVGQSWKWQYLSQSRFDDRPWIAMAPDGTAHVTWNDGSGVYHSLSRDSGQTWQELDPIHSTGGSSHMAISSKGDLAVRIVPWSASGNKYDEGMDFIFINRAGGNSWELKPAPGKRIWHDPNSKSTEIIPRWVEPIAWDSLNNLYYLWSEGTKLIIARSGDLAESWETLTLVVSKKTIYYPFLNADNLGRLAASWFSGFGEALTAHVGLIDFKKRTPLIRTTQPLQVDSWRIHDGTKIKETAGEYFPVIFLSDGNLAAVLTIQAADIGDGFTFLEISER